jgi:hypothetical protein
MSEFRRRPGAAPNIRTIELHQAEQHRPRYGRSQTEKDDENDNAFQIAA